MTQIDEVLGTVERYWDEPTPQIEETSPNATQVNKLTRMLAERAYVDIPAAVIDGEVVTFKVDNRELNLRVVEGSDEVVYQKRVDGEVVHGTTRVDNIALSRLVRWVATGRKKWHSE